jgi:hypothetical protein
MSEEEPSKDKLYQENVMLKQQMQELINQLMRWHLAYTQQKRLTSLAKARSFKEYVKLKLQFETLELLNQQGCRSFQIVDYQGYLEKCTRDLFAYVVNRMKYESKEQLMQKIDLIFDYYERIYAIPKGLDPQILGMIEQLILTTFYNIDILQKEYDQIKKQHQT